MDAKENLLLKTSIALRVILMGFCLWGIQDCAGNPLALPFFLRLSLMAIFGLGWFHSFRVALRDVNKLYP